MTFGRALIDSSNQCHEFAARIETTISEVKGADDGASEPPVSCYVMIALCSVILDNS